MHFGRGGAHGGGVVTQAVLQRLEAAQAKLALERRLHKERMEEIAGEARQMRESMTAIAAECKGMHAALTKVVRENSELQSQVVAERLINASLSRCASAASADDGAPSWPALCSGCRMHRCMQLRRYELHS